MLRVAVRCLLPGLALIATGWLAAQDGPAPTLTLKEAEEAAIRNHPRISVAELKALAAREVTREARAGFFPNISANALAVGTANDNTRLAAIGGLNNPSIFERNAEGLVISQLITDFGRTANLAASARARAQAEQENAGATRAQILLQVDASFYTALEARSVSKVAGQTVATRQGLLDQVTALAGNKLRSDLDVSFARVSLEEGRLLMSRAQNDEEAAAARLAILMGSREVRPFQLVEEPVPAAAEIGTNVFDLINQALAMRPDLARLRHERDAAVKFAKAEKALHYPTVSAVASAGVVPIHDPQLPNNYAAAGVVLNLPLFAGNLYSARQKEAALRAQAAEEALRDEENDVVRDVRIAWLDLKNGQDRLLISQQLAEQASRAFDLAQARYNNGVSSIVELGQAQLNKTSAEITLANTRYETLFRRAALRYQTGTLR